MATTIRPILAVILAGAAVAATALELWTDETGDRYVNLSTTVKGTSLSAWNPDEPLLYGDDRTETGLFRLRLGVETRFSERVNAELAYEHRMQWTSTDAGAGRGIGAIPTLGEAPYRVTQLDWQVTEDGNRFFWRHEIDRALVAIHPGWGEITLGRQAIGLGRGVMFGAVDVFAPFSPTEVDREWRRGVDGLRVEYHTSPTSSVEFLSAFGESWDESAMLARVRGYIGDFDGSLIIGKRADDFMAGGVLSAILGDAEGHIELALFNTPESQADGGLFGKDDLVLKAVLGGSYTFSIGNGLTLVGEYHYSGFGAEDTDDLAKLASNADFQKRYLRGDMQILGRHAIGLQGSYPVNEVWTASLLALQNPSDGSGLISPGLRWDASKNLTLLMNAFFPWGEGAQWNRVASEYGSSPTSIYLQANWYF